MIQHHLSICRPDYHEIVPEIERRLYVDDLLSGWQTVEKAREIKDTAREIFRKASFQLHKWNSNAREIEVTDAVDDESHLCQGTTGSEARRVWASWAEMEQER